MDLDFIARPPACPYCGSVLASSVQLQARRRHRAQSRPCGGYRYPLLTESRFSFPHLHVVATHHDFVNLAIARSVVPDATLLCLNAEAR